MKINEPITIKGVTFKNRIMFPPMTTGYEESGVIGERSFNFYKRIAEGGCAYIVLGNVSCLPGFGLKILSEADIPNFKRLADACHAVGTKLGVQLFYREFDVETYQHIVETEGMAEGRKFMAESMKTFSDQAPAETLRHLIDKAAEAAVIAKKAGIDVIQIHGDRLNGVLLSTKMNHRSDEFGGSFENRTRFSTEMVRAIRKAVPDMIMDYKLGIRLPMENGQIRGNGGLELEEAVKYAQILEKEGIDMIHIAGANHTSNIADTIPPMGIQPYGTSMEAHKRIREVVSIPTSAVARIVTPEAMEALLNNGEADIVAMGRPLVCDPDIGNKCAEGRADEIRLCMMCNKGCTDSIMSASYIQCVLNPENGHEAERKIVPAETPKNVAVVGAGIAGLEAARVAALKGHHVEVFEKELRIGGQINIAAVPPRKEEMFRSLRYYENILPKLGVKFHMGRKADVEVLNGFDHVLVATGATCVTVKVPGYDLPHVTNAWDVLDHKAVVFGNVAVIGGGQVGAETAEYLGFIGQKVSVIEMLDMVAKTESATIRPYMMENYEKYGVKMYVKTRLEKIEPGKVICITETESGEERIEIPADFVVMAVGSKQQRPDLDGLKVPYTFIGDCSGETTADISRATKTAYDAANAI
ncbi:MAG: FAD-dependent oxidoreductase [Firmicutes bacterium]|nr:FAD-dependent oxidoreductase [Bacillota bacterium]